MGIDWPSTVAYLLYELQFGLFITHDAAQWLILHQLTIELLKQNFL